MGEPAVYACNHDRAYGPMNMALFFPLRFRPWVIADVCYVRQVPAHVRADFWHPRRWWSKALCWIVSYLIALPLAYIMCGMEAIPVYYDGRARETFRKSVWSLKEGINIVVFPEKREPFSEYNEQFQDGFVLMAKQYYRDTGKCLKFYPTYVCRENRSIQVGHPIVFDPGASFKRHKVQIAEYLRDAVTEMGREQHEQVSCCKQA